MQHSQGRFTLETAMAQPVAAASVPSNVNTIRPTTTVTNDNVPVGRPEYNMCFMERFASHIRGYSD